MGTENRSLFISCVSFNLNIEMRTRFAFLIQKEMVMVLLEDRFLCSKLGPICMQIGEKFKVLERKCTRQISADQSFFRMNLFAYSWSTFSNTEGPDIYKKNMVVKGDLKLILFFFYLQRIDELNITVQMCTDLKFFHFNDSKM